MHIEVGQPLLVEAVPASKLEGDAEVEWVRQLTNRIGESLRKVTLNLEDWEDLAIVKTADELFALRNGFRLKRPWNGQVAPRARRFFAPSRPSASTNPKTTLPSFRARLDMVNADATDLAQQYGGGRSALLSNFSPPPPPPPPPAMLLSPRWVCALALRFCLAGVEPRLPLPKDRVATPGSFRRW